jgi:hypothetical protein
MDDEQVYWGAVELVEGLGDWLDRGYHLRDRAGGMLCRLDEVIRALLENRLGVEELVIWKRFN